MSGAGSEGEIRAGHGKEVRGRRPGVKQNLFRHCERRPPRVAIHLNELDSFGASLLALTTGGGTKIFVEMRGGCALFTW
jgi:hypothetical protein